MNANVQSPSGSKPATPNRPRPLPTPTLQPLVPSRPSPEKIITSVSSLSPSSLSASSHRISLVSAVPELVQHPDYFLADGNVIFLAENVLFKVHLYFLQRDSEYFSQLLDIHQSSNDLIDDPIVLEDVSSRDFERLLGIFYPCNYCAYDASTVDEWTSILNLAGRWGFSSIRSLAILELSKLAGPVEKIVLGRRHAFEDWLPAAYHALCVRPTPLSFEEGLQLGVAEVIRISEARQLIRGNQSTFVPVSSIRNIEERLFGLVPETIDVPQYLVASPKPVRAVYEAVPAVWSQHASPEHHDAEYLPDEDAAVELQDMPNYLSDIDRQMPSSKGPKFLRAKWHSSVM